MCAEAFAQEATQARGAVPMPQQKQETKLLEEFNISFKNKTPDEVAVDLKRYLTKSLTEMQILPEEGRARGITTRGATPILPDEKKGVDFSFRFEALKTDFQGKLEEGGTVRLMLLPDGKKVLSIKYGDQTMVSKGEKLIPGGDNIDVFVRDARAGETTILTRTVNSKDGKTFATKQVTDADGQVSYKPANFLNEADYLITIGKDGTQVLSGADATAAIKAFVQKTAGMNEVAKGFVQVNAPASKPEPIVLPIGKAESTSAAPHVIADVLSRTEKLLGGNAKWTLPANQTAQTFGREFERLRSELPEIEKFIDGKVGLGAAGVNAVNKFLRDKGFTIQLREATGADYIAAASVFDMKVAWKEPGRETQITIRNADGSYKKNGGDYVDKPGVHLSRNVSFFSAEGHEHPIAELATKDGQRVFITRYDGKLSSQDPLAAEAAARTLSENRRPLDPKTYELGVKFPMVDYNKSGEMSWLIGASTFGRDGKPAVIDQALFQHRLRVDTNGARAQAAATIGASRGIGGPVAMTVDGNFLMWFESPGRNNNNNAAAIPFAALITEEHMKQPESLDRD